MKPIRMLFLLLLTTFTAVGQNQTVNKPLSVTVTSTAASHKVTLNWVGTTMCLDANGNPTVPCTPTGYYIYRSNTSGGPYTKLGGTATAIVTFVDTSVTSGLTYFYVVTSFLPNCTTGQATPCGESAYSNQVAAVIPVP